jgi:hypothetical protein
LVDGTVAGGVFVWVLGAVSGAVGVLGLFLTASKPLGPVLWGTTMLFGFVVLVLVLVLLLLLVVVLVRVSGCLAGAGRGWVT